MTDFDLELLAELPSRDRDWFAANKKRYQAGIMDPAKQLVVELGERLTHDISPAIVAQPKVNGSISPINNDLRFSPDKPPYKDHLLFHFWEGEKKKTAPKLHVRLSASELGFATGIMPADVEAWREAVADDGATLAAAIATLPSVDVVGQELKRVPKPYPADHPAADLLRHKWLQVRWLTDWPSGDLVEHCAAELQRATPVHRWLVEHFV